MLKMSVEDVIRIMREGIYFEDRLSEWKEYDCSTNCYAFVLGIKAKEDDICTNAYWPGNISKNVMGTENDDFADTVVRLEKQILNDFQALGINYKVFQDVDKYQYLKELEHPRECWDILLFRNPKTLDYHFARVGMGGILYHKPGWGYVPRITDIEQIENTKSLSNTGFKFEKRYRVNL